MTKQKGRERDIERTEAWRGGWGELLCHIKWSGRPLEFGDLKEVRKIADIWKESLRLREEQIQWPRDRCLLSASE